MLKFYRILLLTLVAVFLASAAGVARYAADSCTQSRMYRQLAAQTEKFPDDAASTGNNFLPQYQALYAQNSDLAGWIQIDGTGINYPVMQSKQNPDFYLKHNFEKADSPHGCPYVQANCDLQTPSDNILVYGHNMKDGTMFSDLLQYKRESFWEQHRIIQFDTLTAQAEYTVMAVFRGEAENLFAYYLSGTFLPICTALQRFLRRAQVQRWALLSSSALWRLSPARLTASSLPPMPPTQRPSPCAKP